MRILPILSIGLATCAAGCATTPRPIPDEGAQWLAEHGQLAADRRSALIVVAGAEWCEPCNELEAQFWQQPAGLAVQASQVVRDVDAESPVGHAVAARLGVLGYPTTVILRPGPELREVGRIQGFDHVADYAARLQQALQRTEPAADPCPAQLAAIPAADPKGAVPALRCAAAALQGPQAPAAADVLAGQLAPAAAAGAAAWPEDARSEWLAALRLLGRWQARVRDDHVGCARTFAALGEWPGTDAGQKPGLWYWQTKCTLATGNGAAAEQLTTAFLGAHPDTATRALVADMVVHSALDTAWGPRLAERLLRELAAEQPQDPSHPYLLGRMYAHQGQVAAARAAFQRAIELRPGAALYRQQLQRMEATID